MVRSGKASHASLLLDSYYKIRYTFIVGKEHLCYEEKALRNQRPFCLMALGEELGAILFGFLDYRRYNNSMARIKLDLHDIFSNGRQIEAELNRVVREAMDKKIELVEIIPGKGSGQLKKSVLRYLEQGHIKRLYHRIEKDDKNFGRIFVHFRF